MEDNSQANGVAALNIEVPSCSICFNEYGSGIRKPWDLGCGHCICGRCFASLSFSGPKLCPVDRSEWNNPHPAYEFLHVVEQLQKSRGDTSKEADADDELLPEPLRAQLRTTASRFSWLLPDPFRPAATALLLLSDVWRALVWRPGLPGSASGAGLATDMGVREALGHIAVALPPWIHTAWRMAAPSLIVTLITLGWRYVAAVAMLVLPLFVAATVTMEVDFQPHSWPMIIACGAAGLLGSASALDPLLAFGLLQPLIAALLLTALAAGIHHARVCNCDIAIIARQRSLQLMVVACALGTWATGLPAATRWRLMRRLLLLFGMDFPQDRAAMARSVAQAVAEGSGVVGSWPLRVLEDLAFRTGTRIMGAIVGVVDVQPVLGRWQAVGMLGRAVTAPVVLMIAVSCLSAVRSSLPGGGPAVLPGARVNAAAVTRYDLDWLLLRMVVAVGVLAATGSWWLAASANVALHGCFLLLRLVTVNRLLLRMFRDESVVASALGVMNSSSSTTTTTTATHTTSHRTDIRNSLRRRVRAVRLNTSTTASPATAAATVLTHHAISESSPANLTFGIPTATAATVPNTPNAAAISILSEPVTDTAPTEAAPHLNVPQQSTTASLPSSSTSSVSMEFDMLTNLLGLDAISQSRVWPAPATSTASAPDGATEQGEQSAAHGYPRDPPRHHAQQEQDDMQEWQAGGSGVQQQDPPRPDSGLQDQGAPCWSLDEGGDDGQRPPDRQQQRGGQHLDLGVGDLLESSGATEELRAGEVHTAEPEPAAQGPRSDPPQQPPETIETGQATRQVQAAPCSSAGGGEGGVLQVDHAEPQGVEECRDAGGSEARTDGGRDSWIRTAAGGWGTADGSSSSSTGGVYEGVQAAAAVHRHSGASADANLEDLQSEPSCSESIGPGFGDVAAESSTVGGGSEELLPSCSLLLSAHDSQLDRLGATGPLEVRDSSSHVAQSATRCGPSGGVGASDGDGSGTCGSRRSEAGTGGKQEQFAASGGEHAASVPMAAITLQAPLLADAGETGASSLLRDNATTGAPHATATPPEAPTVAESTMRTNEDTDTGRSSAAAVGTSNDNAGTGPVQSARRVVVRDLLASSLASTSSTRLRFRIAAVRAAREGAAAAATAAASDNSPGAHAATTAAAAAGGAGGGGGGGAPLANNSQRSSTGGSRRRGRADGNTAAASGLSGSQRGSRPPQPRGGLFDDFVWTSTVMLLAEWLVCVPPWSNVIEAVDGWMGPLQPGRFIRWTVGILGLGMVIKLVRLMATHTPEEALRPIAAIHSEDGDSGTYLVRVPMRYHLGMAAVPAVCLLLGVLWRPLAALHLGVVSGLELVLRLTVAATMTVERHHRRGSLPLSSTPPVLFIGMFIYERSRRADTMRRNRAGTGATEVASSSVPIDTGSDGAGGNEGAQSAHANRWQRMESGIELTAAALGLDWSLARLLSRLPAKIMGVRERRRLPIVVYP